MILSELDHMIFLPEKSRYLYKRNTERIYEKKQIINLSKMTNSP